MAVKKSLRTRFRYIMFQFFSAQPFGNEIEGKIRAHLLNMLGLLGAPKVKLISLDAEGKGVLRCNSESFATIRQALLFFYGRDYRLRLLKSSGTMKSLREN